MPLSPPATERQSLHHRTISVRGYRRADGNYDIEGHLHDQKDVEFKLASGTRPAGAPVHAMWLRMTIDRDLNIIDAEAVMDAVPYAGACDTIASAYEQLIGMAIRPGFSRRVLELFGSQRGCTHVTDLISSVATTAFQTLAGQGLADPNVQPFQLNKCHALVLDGAVVRRYYPHWYTGADADPAVAAPVA
jgi:hypothetical protein